MGKVLSKWSRFLVIALLITSCNKKDDPEIKEDETKFSIYLIGDSTMSDRTDPENTPDRGWGQMLQLFFNKDVSIKNHAVSGTSTKSFINAGYWQKVLVLLEKGDYVFIQFGHNDEKIDDTARYTNPYIDYHNNLAGFVKSARERGANPLILSPIVRRVFNQSGTLADTHGAYPKVARAVAHENGVPFVDLELKTEILVNQLGPEESKKIFLWVQPGVYESLPDGLQDNSHLSVFGATEVCRLTVEGLREIKSPLCRKLKEQL